MGAWIEIFFVIGTLQVIDKSHPLWVRGLKSLRLPLKHLKDLVAPFMGAWIEIQHEAGKQLNLLVAPFMGAWIEISLWTKSQVYGSGRTLYGCVD